MTTVTTSATYKTQITGDLPDWPLKDVDFQLVAAFFNGAGEEVLAGKTYTMTLDATGNDDGAFYLPTPDNTGDAGVNWRLTLPSGYLTTVTVAYSASAQRVRDLIAAGSTTTDPDTITAALASKASLVSGATADNLASLTAAGDLADSGAAAANVPTADEKAWLTAGEAVGALGTAATADTGDFDAAGSAAAAQTAAQSYADGLNTAMDGRVDILEAALIPVAIADMTATANGSAAIDLAWTYTAVAPITGFRIYRKTGAGAYSLIDTANSGDTSYADSGLSASTEYTYRVDAYNAFFATTGNEDAATTADIQLEDVIAALPGFVALWKLTETSGTTAAEAFGSTAFNGAYAGSIPLAQIALPTAVGGSVAQFQDSSDDIQLLTAALQAAWDWEEGWISLLFKQSNSGIQYGIVYANNANVNYLRITFAGGTAGGQVRKGAPAITASFYQRHQDWTLLTVTWSAAANQFKLYLNGALWTTNAYGSVDTTALASFFVGRISGFRGGIGYISIGAGALPTAAAIDPLYSAIYPTTGRAVLVIGDSWATSNDYWIDQLVADLRTSTGNHWREAPYRIGYSGWAVSAINSSLATDLPAALHTQPDLIVLVCAANDVTAGTAEATFKAAFGGILDTLQTNCPDVPVVINFPYRDDAYNGSYDAAALAIKGWMETVIAAKSGTYYTIDGNTWFKTNIDTWSSDRIHPTTEAGFAELVGEIMTAAGY